MYARSKKRDNRPMTSRVIVPNLVGMAFHDARDLVAELGVALANPDPDGAPIGAIAWPELFYIATQSPPAGADVGAGESIRVTVRKHDDGAVGRFV